MAMAHRSAKLQKTEACANNLLAAGFAGQRIMIKGNLEKRENEKQASKTVFSHDFSGLKLYCFEWLCYSFEGNSPL